MLLLAPGPAVRQGGAALRASCSSDAEKVAQLDEGAALKIRFAFSGDIGTCYKVEAGDRAGYLRAAEIDGLEEYERGRRMASDQEIPQMIRAEVGRLRTEMGSSQSAGGALQLIESNQPREALRMIETSLLPAARRDPYMLALAGLAAYQSDETKRAADYWAESLAIRPDPDVERIYQRVQKELKADTSRERLSSTRFLLRFDNAELSGPAASKLLDALDDEYARIDLALGCGIQEKITAIVQTREAYSAITGAAEWSGGMFDGRIRVVMEPSGITPRTRTAFAHEIVHACLARNGRFDRWFHEGMAQRWSGDRPDAATLQAAAELKKEPGLSSTQQARLFYAWSWLAVDRLYSRIGDQGVRNLIRSPQSVPAPSLN